MSGIISEYFVCRVDFGAKPEYVGSGSCKFVVDFSTLLGLPDLPYIYTIIRPHSSEPLRGSEYPSE